MEVVNAVTSGGVVRLAFKSLGNAVSSERASLCPDLACMLLESSKDGPAITSIDLSCNSLSCGDVQTVCEALVSLREVSGYTLGVCWAPRWVHRRICGVCMPC